MLELVRRCCVELLERPSLAALQPRLRRRLEELEQPLRVALAGHVSAGKSTLVNALIGRRLAPTGTSETTTVNAWFCHGCPERIVYRRLDGSTVERPLPAPGDEPEPPDGFAADDTRAITYFLDKPLLADLTVIDTPGLFSPNSENSARADALVAARTTRAADMANALLYLTKELPGSEVEDAKLQAFQSLFRGLAGKMPINSVLVLTRIDERWPVDGDDPRDPLAIAGDLLAGHAGELWRRVWTGAGLIGNLAEEGRTGPPFTESELADLRQLAEFPHRRRLIESDGMLFSAGVPADRARALRARLHPYGLYLALELIDGGANTPAQLMRGLFEASGLPDIIDTIDTVFRQRAALLKAESVLSAIESDALPRSVEISDGDAAWILQRVEAVRTADASRELRRLRAIRILSSEDGHLSLSDPRRRELCRLFGGRTPAERLGEEPDAERRRLAASAHQQGARWSAIQQVAPVDPTLLWIADEAEAAYRELAQTLEQSLLFN